MLDEALSKLPPRFKQQLDRRIQVSWTDKMPADAYGQASLVSTLALNRRLLPSLTDGSAAHQSTNRPHGTVRQELLATVLHELTHIYNRARLWPDAERSMIARCKRQQGTLARSASQRLAVARHNAVSPSATIHACSTWPVGRSTWAAEVNGSSTMANWCAAPTVMN